MKELMINPLWVPDNSGFIDYDWNIRIGNAIAGEGPAGPAHISCTVHYSLYRPKTEPGKRYPVVVVPGGVGDKSVRMTSTYATRKWQEIHPCYVLHVGIPYEGIMNFESQMYCLGQTADIIENFAERYGDVDLNRVYSTGGSQGAIWSYMLEAARPGFFAGLFINAGTIVHTTWGDMQKLENLMSVPLLIVHGMLDTAIPVNEAYRVYNNLKRMGKKNMACVIFDVGHIVHKASSVDGTPTKMMEWMFAQSKEKSAFEDIQYLSDYFSADCTGPWLYESFDGERGDYSCYLWAGIDALSRIPSWNTAIGYARQIETHDNETWKQVQATALPLTEDTSSGKYVLGKFRIPDEGTTTYDTVVANIIRPFNEEGAPGGMPPRGGPGGMIPGGMPPGGGPGMPPPPSAVPLDTGRMNGPGTGPRTLDPVEIGLCAGDYLCMTMQGYTGYYGDDLEAFGREWDVEWALIEGSVSNISVTAEASPYPINRPATVTLDHGKGPNHKGSLATDNALDGKQVYLKIALCDQFRGNTLLLHIRLIRKFTDGQCAAYNHAVCVKVKSES